MHSSLLWECDVTWILGPPFHPSSPQFSCLKWCGYVFLVQYSEIQEKASPTDASVPHRTWAPGLGFQQPPSVRGWLCEALFPLFWSGPLQGFCAFLLLVLFLFFICPKPHLFCLSSASSWDRWNILLSQKKKSLQRVLTWSVSCCYPGWAWRD